MNTTMIASDDAAKVSVSPVFNGQVIVSLPSDVLSVDEATVLREALSQALNPLTVTPQALPESIPHRAARGRTAEEDAYLSGKVA